MTRTEAFLIQRSPMLLRACRTAEGKERILKAVVKKAASGNLQHRSDSEDNAAARYRRKQNERMKLRLNSADEVTCFRLKRAIRRNERAMRLDADGDETGWITVHPNGGTGVPIKIEESTGEVVGGAGGALNGTVLSGAESQPLSELKQSSGRSSSGSSSSGGSSSGSSLSSSGSGIAAGASVSGRPDIQSLNERIRAAGKADQEKAGYDDRKSETAAILDAAPIGTKFTMIEEQYRGEYGETSTFYKTGEDTYAGGYCSEKYTAQDLLLHQDFSKADAIPTAEYPSDEIMRSIEEGASGSTSGDVPTSQYSDLNIGVGECSLALGVTLYRMNENTFLDVDNGNLMTLEEAEEAAAQGKNLYQSSAAAQASEAMESEMKAEIQNTAPVSVNGDCRRPMTSQELMDDYEFMVDRNGGIWKVDEYECANLSGGSGGSDSLEDLVSDGVTGIKTDDIIAMELEAAEPAYSGEKRPHLYRDDLPETVLEESGEYTSFSALEHRKALAVAAETGYDYSEAQDAVEAIESYSSKGDYRIRQAQNMTEEEAAEAGLSRYYEQGEVIEQYLKDAQKWDSSETVYRGINVTDEVYDDLMSKAEDGEVLDQGGLSSWTTLDYVAEMFSHNRSGQGRKCVMFTCNSSTEKAVSVAHISKAEDDEAEVLYSKDARFVATGSYTAESEQYPGTTITYIELKEVQ